MRRDPFYQSIIERLSGVLDPALFEACAADILRVDFPTLVPIPGGSDSGRDGAIADGEGVAYPLITTTGKNVIGNLTRNLKSYLKDGGSRRKCVLATSQSLTEKRRKNLEKRAEELGFDLVQVYEQQAIADRLYRNSHWCNELLNLTGAPPALSVVPETRRPLAEVVLVGREADRIWLSDTEGDRLLVGQPGSGKTFLLYALARNDWGLFVTSDDIERIANAVREQSPRIVIVDDAHIRVNVLKHLIHFRQQTGADFAIVTTTWPGEEDVIGTVLNLSTQQIRTLDLLSRDEIVDVIKGVGLHGPTELIREIVDQAVGRPGLAATLAQLCLRGSVKDVALGDRLSQDVRTTFEPLVGRIATEILATFAIGGNAGMPMDVVAHHLGSSLVDVRSAAARLAAGGLITDAGRDDNDVSILSVHPATLREALVRDVFFRNPAPLPYRNLLKRATNIRSMVLTLIGAKARGATIPSPEIHELLEIAQSEDAWKAYASLGDEEAIWVLTHRPELALTIAYESLRTAPTAIIPRLLTLAITDRRPLHSHPDHPLRQIEGWIKGVMPGRGEGPRRRELLVREIDPWLTGGGDAEVAAHAVSLALSPSFEIHSIDPGLGMTVTFRRGLLSNDELTHISTLWPSAVAVIHQSDPRGWKSIINLIREWAHPDLSVYNPAAISEDLRELMRAYAVRMLVDIAQITNERPAVLREVSRIAKRLGSDLEVVIDGDFEVLFPNPDFEDWQAAQDRRYLDICELAAEWSTRDPETIIERICNLEAEAGYVERAGVRCTTTLCDQLAKRVEKPEAWLACLLRHRGARADLAEPFLRRSLASQRPGSRDLGLACLEQPSMRLAAVTAILTTPDLDAELVAAALAASCEFAPFVEYLASQDRIPVETLRLLLERYGTATSRAAAVGLWLADPRGTIPDNLERLWRSAIVRSDDTKDYWIGKIIGADAGLAHDWLRARLKAGDLPIWLEHSPPFREAVDSLDAQARRCILQVMPASRSANELFARLVGDDLDLYQTALQDPRLRPCHLAPLTIKMDETLEAVPFDGLDGVWADKAILALSAGYEHEQLASAALGVSRTFSGNESDYWKKWEAAFSKLHAHNDPDIQKIAERILAFVGLQREHALISERSEAVFGLNRRY